MTGLSVVSQTLCKIEVFPAFALPMMSTLNWTFGTRGRGAGAGAGAGSRRLVLCFAPVVRLGKRCKKKDMARC